MSEDLVCLVHLDLSLSQVESSLDLQEWELSMTVSMTSDLYALGASGQLLDGNLTTVNDGTLDLLDLVQDGSDVLAATSDGDLLYLVGNSLGLSDGLLDLSDQREVSAALGNTEFEFQNLAVLNGTLSLESQLLGEDLSATGNSLDDSYDSLEETRASVVTSVFLVVTTVLTSVFLVVTSVFATVLLVVSSVLTSVLLVVTSVLATVFLVVTTVFAAMFLMVASVLASVLLVVTTVFATVFLVVTSVLATVFATTTNNLSGSLGDLTSAFQESLVVGSAGTLDELASTTGSTLGSASNLAADSSASDNLDNANNAGDALAALVQSATNASGGASLLASTSLSEDTNAD